MSRKKKLETIVLETPTGSDHVLLHSCCAPCSGEVMERMADAGIRFTIFFYNPNIHPRATVEDGEGEFFALLPQSTLRQFSSAPQKPDVSLADETKSQSTKLILHEESDAEKAIMFVAWAFLFINIIGGVLLIAQFGSEPIPGSRAKIWNIELIAVIAVACLSSIFLVALGLVHAFFLTLAPIHGCPHHHHGP